MSYLIIEGGRNISLESGHQPQFMYGLDASKASSPGKGDTYYAIDNLKQYICYVSTIWTLVSSNNYIKYTNLCNILDPLLVITNAGTATTTFDAVNFQIDMTVPGIAATPQGTSFLLDINRRTTISATNPIILNFQVRNIVFGNGTPFIEFGLTGINEPIAEANGAFVWNDNNTGWFARTGNGSTKTDTAITIADGNHVTILITTSIVLFFVNGALVATHTTTLPSGNTMGVQARVAKTENSSSVSTLSFEFIEMLKLI